MTTHETLANQGRWVPDPESLLPLRNSMVSLRHWIGAVAGFLPLPRHTLVRPDNSPEGEMLFKSVSPRDVSDLPTIDQISFAIKDLGEYRGCAVRFTHTHRRTNDHYFLPPSDHLPGRFAIRDTVELLNLEVRARADGSAWVAESQKNGVETTVIAHGGSERLLSRGGNYPHSSMRESVFPIETAHQILGSIVEIADSHLNRVPGRDTITQAGLMPREGFDPLTMEVPAHLRDKWL